MKKCPQCGREYDNTMAFCLDDGAELLYGPALSEQGPARGPREGIPSGVRDATGEPFLDEPQTAILSGAAGLTRGQVRTTDRTVILPAGTEAEPHKSLGGLSEWPSLSDHRAAKPLIAAVLGIVIVTALGIGSYLFYTRGDSKQIRSIAVLPFQNSGDLADSEYISDGLAESMIYRLTQIPDLKVSPRSSVFRYKGKEVDSERIGAELGVDAVMSGRIVKRGDNLTISVDLVDVRERKTLWGEQFERKMSDLLATQREIAATIAQKLQLKLTGETATGITKNYTDSNEAYRDYLQGRFYWNKRSPDTISKAVEHLERAVQKDPNFALAYAGLADAQMITQYLSRKWSDDYLIAKAQENAERAIQLDPTLAEPHATLGLVKSYQWDWDGSEREFKTALELNPKYATTYHWYSRLLRTRGRYTEALTQIRKGQEADPLSIPIAENVIQNLVENGDLDGALAQCKRNIELDPNYWSVYFRMAAGYFEKGQKDEGFAAASKSIELVGRAPIAMGFWGYALAHTGKRDEALAVAKELERKYAAKEMDGVRIASVYLGLGDKDKAFEWLEKDFQARRPTLMEMRLELEFRSLRDDPRYKDLLKRMGLPE
jgi:TolB-like protein/Tfp pilus assembly protein PilF